MPSFFKSILELNPRLIQKNYTHEAGSPKVAPRVYESLNFICMECLFKFMPRSLSSCFEWIRWILGRLMNAVLPKHCPWRWVRAPLLKSRLWLDRAMALLQMTQKLVLPRAATAEINAGRAAKKDFGIFASDNSFTSIHCSGLWCLSLCSPRADRINKKIRFCVFKYCPAALVRHYSPISAKYKTHIADSRRKTSSRACT